VFVYFLGDSERPLPKDEDAEEFKIMRSSPVPSVEELMDSKSYQQEAEPSTQQSGPAYSGRYQQAVLPGTETRLEKSPSQPQAIYVLPPSQFRTPVL
jgi:hypothetical protein